MEMALRIAAGTLRATRASPLEIFQRVQEAERSHSMGVPQHISFQLAETEISEYLAHTLRNRPRPGLESVTTKVFPYNYYYTFGIVDFGADEQWSPVTIPCLERPILSGRKTICVDFRLRGNTGWTVLWGADRAAQSSWQLGIPGTS